MQANIPIDQPKYKKSDDYSDNEDKSLSRMPDLSQFGLSAPYPKTLIRQLDPKFDDDKVKQSESDNFNKIQDEAELISSSEDHLALGSSQQIDLSQTDSFDNSEVNIPDNNSIVEPTYLIQNNNNQTMIERIKTILTTQHSFKAIPLSFYIGFIMFSCLVIYCLFVVILDKLGFKSTVTHLINP